jgi:hypothetical protein
LFNTPLTCAVAEAAQYQYVAIATAVIKNEPIKVPSLAEGTGKFAAAQAAIDIVDPYLALIHELMATSVVRVWADLGPLWMAPILWVHLGEAVIHRLVQQEPRLNRKALQAAWNETFDLNGLHALPLTKATLVRLTEIETASWLPFYGECFDELLRSSMLETTFRDLHQRTGAAMRKLVAGAELTPGVDKSESLNLLMDAARYPLGIPRRDFEEAIINAGLIRRGDRFSVPDQPTGEGTGSRAFEKSMTLLAEVGDAPLCRLDSLLTAIESAPSHVVSATEWKAYLELNLDPLHGPYTGLLGPFAHSLWSQQGLEPLGRSYEVFFNQPLMAGMLITEPVVISRKPIVTDFGTILALESIRQSILCEQSPVCLCQPSIHGGCDFNLLLKAAQIASDPDSGGQARFHPPECEGLFEP